MDSKVFLSLVSVLLGWVLGQGTSLAKDWWAARRLRHGLILELHDIDAQLQRVVFIHTRHLQVLAMKGIEPVVSISISNMFFQQYFKEAFAKLNREQRISYQLIHGSLDNLNRQHEKLTTFLEDFYKEHRTSPDDAKTLAAVDAWGDRIIAAYTTAMTVRWHIRHHLNNSSAPPSDLMGPMHESYVKFEYELDAEVKTIMAQAKDFKREDFEKIYDAKAFSRNHDAG